MMCLFIMSFSEQQGSDMQKYYLIFACYVETCFINRMSGSYLSKLPFAVFNEAIKIRRILPESPLNFL